VSSRTGWHQAMSAVKNGGQELEKGGGGEEGEEGVAILCYLVNVVVQFKVLENLLFNRHELENICQRTFVCTYIRCACVRACVRVCSQLSQENEDEEDYQLARGSDRPPPARRTFVRRTISLRMYHSHVEETTWVLNSWFSPSTV
jgi:hypothetical protein